MKKKYNIYLRYSLMLVAGLLLGWLFFHSRDKVTPVQEYIEEADASTIWTCAMHPQIRMDKPGKCPICGMDLIPLNQNVTDMDPGAVKLSDEAARLADVQTTVVTRMKPVKEVRLYGKVQADERLLQSQVAHTGGRIEKLFVNFTGETVKEGQTLALIFSPELVTAQQELLEAAKLKEKQPEIYEAARERLRQWKLTNSQISAIENSGKVKTDIEVTSNTSGIVMSRMVNSGDYVSPGSVLFEVADLSKVWVMFDAYESDLAFLKEGETIRFTVQAIPGKDFSGKISFIDPVIDPVTRVAKVRIETDNRSGQLKPGMFVTGIARTGLNPLTNDIVIPGSAVLWTGERSVVYVKDTQNDEPVFKMREIELGPSLGDAYVVAEGLKEGEEVVTRGTFSVDAAAQLEGKPSMMNQEGIRVSAGHDHGNMKGMNESEMNEQSGSDKKNTNTANLPLNEIYNHYIELKNNLVKSNSELSGQAAEKIIQSIKKVDMKQLKGSAHTRWMEMAEKLEKSSEKISASDDLEKQRETFSDLSNTLYTLIKNFGLTGQTVFYQFCPMAGEGKGAVWLSEIKEIRNPYYGDAMLTCGETRETLNYQKPVPKMNED